MKTHEYGMGHRKWVGNIADLEQGNENKFDLVQSEKAQRKNCQIYFIKLTDRVSK